MSDLKIAPIHTWVGELKVGELDVLFRRYLGASIATHHSIANVLSQAWHLDSLSDCETVPVDARIAARECGKGDAVFGGTIVLSDLRYLRPIDLHSITSITTDDGVSR